MWRKEGLQHAKEECTTKSDLPLSFIALLSSPNELLDLIIAELPLPDFISMSQVSQRFWHMLSQGTRHYKLKLEERTSLHHFLRREAYARAPEILCIGFRGDTCRCPPVSHVENYI